MFAILSVGLWSSCPSTAVAQKLDYPLSVVATSQGVVYVADRNLPGIWSIEQGQASIYFQGSKKFRTPLNAIRCLALDSQGKLLAGDSATREIYRFDEPGKPTPLTSGAIGIPMALGVDSQGTIIVADLETHAIYRVDGSGGPPQRWVSVPAVRGLAVDAQDRVWLASHGPDALLRFSASGEKETVVAGQAFQFSHHLALDAAQNAYIADGYGKCIWKVPAGGKPEKLVSDAPLQNPVGLCIQGERLLVADPHAKNVFAVPLAGGKLEPLVSK